MTEQMPETPAAPAAGRPWATILVTLVIVLAGLGLVASFSLAKNNEAKRKQVAHDILYPAGSQSTPGTETPAPAAVSTPTPAPVPAPAPVAEAALAVTHRVVIQTAKGSMDVELYGKEAPETVNNFVKLIKKGFYNGLTFHRVETGAGFELIQGGCPKGDGTGGPGWNIKREISPRLRHWEGAIAMARSADPDSAGSQFYICNCEIGQLDDEYAVFGKVTKGLEVSKKIAVGDKMLKVTVK
jgi:peptidyl-prolyl cis-trans isomerase B (cyclophilin B)